MRPWLKLFTAKGRFRDERAHGEVNEVNGKKKEKKEESATLRNSTTPRCRSCEDSEVLSLQEVWYVRGGFTLRRTQSQHPPPTFLQRNGIFILRKPPHKVMTNLVKGAIVLANFFVSFLRDLSTFLCLNVL